MAKIKFTNRAVNDLSLIWNYTFENWSENQADKYYNEILNECSIISNSPDIGRTYKGISQLLRGHNINSHIIFYRTISKDEIEIERILHKRMDLRNRIKDYT